MTRQSAIRVREIQRLDDQRAPVMAGIGRLFKAMGHLRKNGSPEDLSAIGLLGCLVGFLERENKSLYERTNDLWLAVVKSDGAELSSKEIAEEQRRVQEGLDGLERILVHIRKTIPYELLKLEGSVVWSLMRLEFDLQHSRSDLDRRQEQYQMARAEAEARNFSYSDN
jgi:hypothetical protein